MKFLNQKLMDVYLYCLASERLKWQLIPLEFAAPAHLQTCRAKLDSPLRNEPQPAYIVPTTCAYILGLLWSMRALILSLTVFWCGIPVEPPEIDEQQALVKWTSHNLQQGRSSLRKRSRLQGFNRTVSHSVSSSQQPSTDYMQALEKSKRKTDKLRGQKPKGL